MFKIIRAGERFHKKMPGIDAHWLFSFDNYHDPENMSFGNLRVFNDDIFHPGAGFPLHFHREMEIVSVILRGEITHGDNIGNNSVIKEGQIQHMSAGRGIQHSEFNQGREDLNILQIWILPSRKGVDPGYKTMDFDSSDFKNRWKTIASDKAETNILEMYADASIIRAELESGKELSYNLKKDRGFFLYLISGSLTTMGEPLEARDQIRISGDEKVTIKAASAASIIAIDVKL